MSTSAGQASLAMVRRNPYWSFQRKARDASKLYKRQLALAGGGTDAHGKPLRMKQSWHIVTGDLVQVTSTSRKRDVDNKGKWMKHSDGSWVAQDWLGAQGKVLAVLRRSGQIIVEGVNIKTRIAQPTADTTGHFFKVESPIPYSQVTLVDPATNAPVAGLTSKGRVRVAAETGSQIPRPRFTEYLERKKAPKAAQTDKVNPLTDTAPEHVLTRTYRRPTITHPQLRPESEQTDPEALLSYPEDIELRVARIKF